MGEWTVTEHAAGRPALLDLVDTALDQSKLSGICELLRSIAQSLRAYGCFLWEVAPGSDLESRPPSGFLFVLAQWFTDGHTWAFDDLSLDSTTGKAVISGQPQNVTAVTDDHRRQRKFLEKAGIQAFCSLPLAFTDGALGALNLYRKMAEPFSEAEIAQAGQLASLFPRLYRAVRSEVTRSLLLRVEDTLTAADQPGAGVPLTKEQMRRLIHRICELVKETFECVETSMYLEDRLEQPGCYRLAATSWPRWEELPFPKESYRLNDRGITPWMLAHAKPVRIIDLAHFERDKDLILRQYPDLTWTDPLNILSTIRKILELSPEAELQPVSFMGAPMVIGGAVTGAIRCCAMRHAPYYFAGRELDLLNLVARQIGQYWNNWLSRRETEEENRSWRLLVDGIKDLNRIVHTGSSPAALDERGIFREGLTVIGKAIPGLDGADVRLLDRDTGELCFTEASGSVWADGNQEIPQERRSRRFPVRPDGPLSPGARVFGTGIVRTVPEVEAEPLYSVVFPGVKGMVIAPIRSGGEVLGVLDLLSRTDRPFPRHAESIADLFGQQLGLYHSLAALIRKHDEAANELRQLLGRQSQTYEDLGHQLKTPVYQAHAIARSALVGKSTAERLRACILALRGLLWKAERVTRAVGLFADLASSTPIAPRLSRVEYPKLVRNLEWAAADIEKMLGEARRIRFVVDRDSFHVLHDHEIRVDHDLLEHAISNLLDNAGKYSYSDTTVRIYGGLTGAGRFHISVVNKGLRLQKKEVPLCVQRGWRSEDAQAVTGEGSGIGLWIVDNIMRVHEGELLIIPVTAEGNTEVKLLFPVGRTRSH